MPVMTLIEAIRHGLTQEMELNPRTLVLGEDVGVRGGVFGATRGLLERFGPERVIDMPLAESSIVGVAIGAAVAGWRPLAEIQFADYIHPAMNQIINEAARIRYRTNGDYTCPVVIRAPFGGGVHGALYHSQSVEGLFYHVPGLKIVIPSTPYDARGLLRAAMEQEDPVLFFEHKRAYRL
ncbi:MAG: alpha-ketoacid dehydrogenase subunit beta, partial [Firmicutes bacterium]|nr:alpha-ketoacid dehydrogenase subunit beta [Bacillota bacterium]